MGFHIVSFVFFFFKISFSFTGFSTGSVGNGD